MKFIEVSDEIAEFVFEICRRSGKPEWEVMDSLFYKVLKITTKSNKHQTFFYSKPHRKSLNPK